MIAAGGHGRVQVDDRAREVGLRGRELDGRIAHLRNVIRRAIRQPTDARSTAVAVDHGLAVQECIGIRHADGVCDAIDDRHRPEGPRDGVMRSSGDRGIEFDGNAALRVGRRISQPDRRVIDDDHVIGVLVGQPADARATAMAVEDLVTGRKTVRVAEIDHFGRVRIPAGDGRLGIDCDTEAVLRAGGTGQIQADVRCRRDVSL